MPGARGSSPRAMEQPTLTESEFAFLANGAYASDGACWHGPGLDTPERAQVRASMLARRFTDPAGLITPKGRAAVDYVTRNEDPIPY